MDPELIAKLSPILFIGGIWVLSLIVNAVTGGGGAQKRPPRDLNRSGQGSGGPSFDDFLKKVEEAKQRQEAQRQAQERPAQRPLRARPVARPVAQPAAPIEPARPEERRPALAQSLREEAPRPRLQVKRKAAPEPTPQRQALRHHHVASALEQPKDLSDVDERVLASTLGAHHIQDRVGSPDQPRDGGRRRLRALQDVASAAPEVAPKPAASFNMSRMGAHLTPLQQAFLLGEVLAHRPGIDGPPGLKRLDSI